MTDHLTADTLRSALGNHAPEILRVSEVTASTNDDAKRAFADGLKTPALFVSAEQTAGRGRMGRQFLSPAGSGVYFSLFLPLDNPPQSVLYATCATGVAVRRGILAATGCDTCIKWVNDLRFRDRKVCGILAEAPVIGNRYGLVLGVGINLRPVVFPPELAQIAGSLDHTECPRSTLIAACVREMRDILAAPADAWQADYRAHSCTLGHSVRILRAGTILAEGIAEDIRQDGALLLRMADGSLTAVTSGEVSVR